MKVYSGNKKSLYALCVLGVAAVYMVYSQFFSGPTYKTVTPQTVATPHSDESADASGSPPAAATKGSGPNISQAKGRVSKGASSKGKNGEFHPVYIAKKVEERPDIAALDPTIRFDLLDRTLKVPQAGAERDLFQISKTPPAKANALTAANEPIVKPYQFVGPHTPPPPPPPPGPPPPPPPLTVPFKFYGTSAVHPDGKRTGYFIIPGPTPDQDEIFKAEDGDVVKGHFRIVQISAERVTVEDTTDKRRAPVNLEKEATQ
jgi:hypothetical protein